MSLGIRWAYVASTACGVSPSHAATAATPTPADSHALGAVWRSTWHPLPGSRRPSRSPGRSYPQQRDWLRRVRADVLAEDRDHRRGPEHVVFLAVLHRGEVQPAAGKPDVHADDLGEEVDVVDGQAEHLALPHARRGAEAWQH